MLKFPYIEEVAVQNGYSWYSVPADKIIEVCTALRDEHKFDCLSCLSGMDRGDFLEVVYHIFSYERKETIILKVKAVRNDQKIESVPSVSGIWPSANWMEREAYDLLGINFTGHPNLLRIMLPEDWIGHPLRKDFKEPEEYCGMSTLCYTQKK